MPLGSARTCRSQTSLALAQRSIDVGPEQPTITPHTDMTSTSPSKWRRLRVCRGSGSDSKYSTIDFNGTVTLAVGHILLLSYPAAPSGRAEQDITESGCGRQPPQFAYLPRLCTLALRQSPIRNLQSPIKGPSLPEPVRPGRIASSLFAARRLGDLRGECRAPCHVRACQCKTGYFDRDRYARPRFSGACACPICKAAFDRCACRLRTRGGQPGFER